MVEIAERVFKIVRYAKILDGLPTEPAPVSHAPVPIRIFFRNKWLQLLIYKFFYILCFVRYDPNKENVFKVWLYHIGRLKHDLILAELSWTFSRANREKETSRFNFIAEHFDNSIGQPVFMIELREKIGRAQFIRLYPGFEFFKLVGDLPGPFSACFNFRLDKDRLLMVAILNKQYDVCIPKV